MINTNLKRKKCIIKRAQKIKSLLETNLSYEKINSDFQKKINNSLKVNFTNSDYSNGKKYRFPYGYESALTIIQSCQYYTNSFELLSDESFKSDLNLNLNQTGKSNLSEKAYFETLEISKWCYEDFVISAIYFHIEKLHENYSERKEISINKSFFELNAFSSHVGLFLLNGIYGKKLFTTLENTNLFVKYPDSWLYGFISVLRALGSDTMTSYETQDRLYFFQKINTSFLVNFQNILFYLKAFENFIPLSVIKQVGKYSYLTQSIYILYYILKIYQNNLFSNLNEFQKEKNHYEFVLNLNNELNKIIPKFLFLNNFEEFFKNNGVWLLFLVSLISGNHVGITTMSIGLPAPDPNQFPQPKESNSGKKTQKSPSKIVKPVSKNQQKIEQNKQKKYIQEIQTTQKTKSNYDPILEQSYSFSPNVNCLSPTSSSPDLFPLIAINTATEQYCQLGRSSDYQSLLNAKSNCTQYMNENFSNFSELCSSAQDHFWTNPMLRLMGLYREKARSITTTSILNSCKENAKKGQRMPCRLDSLNGIGVREMSSLLLDESINGMWQYAQLKHPTHLNDLDYFGALEPLRQSYIDNKVWAVNEMCAFANQYDLPLDEKGVIAPFFIRDILNNCFDLIDQLKQLTNYDSPGAKFHLNYVIEQTFESLNYLHDIANSLTLDLNLLPNHRFLEYVKQNLDEIYAAAAVQANAALSRYKLNMDKLELPKLSVEDFNDLKFRISVASDLQNRSNLRIVYTQADLNDDFMLTQFKIGQFNSRAQLPWCNTSQYSNTPSIFIQTIDPMLLPSFAFTKQQQGFQSPNIEPEDISLQEIILVGQLEESNLEKSRPVLEQTKQVLEQPELEQPELEQPELEQPELEQLELEQPEQILEQPEQILEQPE